MRCAMKTETIEGADAAAIADWIADMLAKVMASREGPIAMAVPGGSTPFPIFEELATRGLDFARLVVWPTDDRIVPENHAASNTGKIRALFEPVGARVVALELDCDVPQFDLVWLGMGADGHIASLFPNTDPDPADPMPVRRITPDPLPPEAPFDRITLTIPALVRTSALMFVIRGDEKRAVMEAAIQGDHDLPVARLLNAARVDVTLFT